MVPEQRHAIFVDDGYCVFCIVILGVWDGVVRIKGEGMWK